MELQSLIKLTQKRLRRIGRGHGSGRVKTSGRGTKGQKARRDIPLHFEGGALPLTKRLPFLRGKGKNHVINRQPICVNVGLLSVLPEKSLVNIDTLVKHNIVDARMAGLNGVKILGNGELKIALTVKLPVSSGARIKIEKAKGTVEIN